MNKPQPIHPEIPTYKELQERIKELEANPQIPEGYALLQDWQPMDTSPSNESMSFLVLMGGNSVATSLIVQVSRFEGNLYPDQLDTNVDWYDMVKSATHWMPLIEAPKP